MHRGWKWSAVAVVGAFGFSGVGLTALGRLGRTPEYCSWCHVMEPYYTSWTGSDDLAGVHHASGITCQECHPRSLGDLVEEVALTISDRYAAPLPEMKVGNEACFSCHDDYPSLARATAELDPNPHDTHLGAEECRSCHKMHKPSPGLAYCRTCHHTGDLIHCNQCHKEEGS